MRPKDRTIGAQLTTALGAFNRNIRALPGLCDEDHLQSLVEQLIESIHRVRYVSLISQRNISPQRANPITDLFDPLKAAIVHWRAGDSDEAFWLVFLSVHFGKHRRDGWKLTREVYGRLGDGLRWDWATTSADPVAFRRWLTQHRKELSGRFGNHRKYASLDANSNTGTGAVIESYVRWVMPPRTHRMIIEEIQQRVGIDPRVMFGALYESLNAVAYFGRMAKFDFLTMVGKLQLAQIEPGSIYLNGATGPLKGACLLFTGNKDTQLPRGELDLPCIELAEYLGVNMQVLEDALCNWQKSPARFIPFRG